jgi:DNA-binding winged helix-turn-helix (wHTH) protein/tetratricopeptide (TPR) repeat protein
VLDPVFATTKQLKKNENLRKLSLRAKAVEPAMTSATPHMLMFDGYTLDPARRSLTRDGQPLTLRPQAMEVLCHLAREAGRPVSKAELFEAVWPGISVTDDSLVQCIRDIRRVLQDRHRRIVKTVPRLGYLFAGLVSMTGDDEVTHSPDRSRPASSSALPLHMRDRPLISVARFSDLSGGHAPFADGLAEDLVTALCRIRWLAVVGGDAKRGSSACYQLKGSVRHTGERVRINVHIIDAATGVCLWSEVYDRRVRERLAVQEEIAGRVAAAFESYVFAAEGAGALLQPAAALRPWDLVVRARSLFARVTKSDTTAALVLLKELVNVRPDYAAAQSLLGLCFVSAAHMGWIARDQGLPSGREHAIRALALDDRDSWAHIALGYWALMERHTDESIAAFRRAVELNPNSAAARSQLSRGLAFAGLHAEAIEHGEAAIRLAPFDPQKALFLGGIAVAKHAAGRFDEAVHWSLEAQRLRPGFQGSRRMLCANLALAGRTAEARALLSLLRRDQPELSMSWLTANVPYQTPGLIERYQAGMWKAGLR